jgi:hypothetical protein
MSCRPSVFAAPTPAYALKRFGIAWCFSPVLLSKRAPSTTRTGDGCVEYQLTALVDDLGYFDDETCRLEPIANPFGPKVLPMCPAGIKRHPCDRNGPCRANRVGRGRCSDRQHQSATEFDSVVPESADFSRQRGDSVPSRCKRPGSGEDPVPPCRRCRQSSHHFA